jgi:beta-glucosidase
MVKAHRLSWRKIQSYRGKQEKNKANIGIAHNIVDFHTYYINHLIDYLIMRLLHWAINRKFLNKIKRYMNFIGVNYYFHIRIKRGKYGIFSLETIDTRTENREASDMNWEVNPQGIFEALLTVRRYDVPIYVTENGIATTNDHKRIRFLVAHLKEVYHAIKTGVDVRGYFFWSLIDNYEWDKGFWPRFGLIDINYKNLKRTPRPSAFVYKKICEENAIAHELLKFLGHGIRWQPTNGDYEPK